MQNRKETLKGQTERVGRACSTLNSIELRGEHWLIVIPLRLTL